LRHDQFGEKSTVSPVQPQAIRIREAHLAFAALATLNTDMRFSPVKRIAVLVLIFIAATPSFDVLAQEFLPAPPADRTQIYTLDSGNQLVPLPFEMARTPLDGSAVARRTKTSYVELKGEHAVTTLSSTPRLFLFTTQGTGKHPPFLVWLTPKRGARRATAVAQAGWAGFAISSEEIVKPTVRVLASFGVEVFMELRPRTSLVPGEYAIIGDDLTRVATFRVVADALR
jgi:hypothetical protein